MRVLFFLFAVSFEATEILVKCVKLAQLFSSTWALHWSNMIKVWLTKSVFAPTKVN